jgi:hypothetical protein
VGLLEPDQRAILRQANDQEFERYVTHAHMKLRKPMREERAGKEAEAPAPGPSPRSPNPGRGGVTPTGTAAAFAVTSTGMAAGTAADVQ